MAVRAYRQGPVKVIALHGWFGSAGGWGMLSEVVDRDTYSWEFLEKRGYGDRRDEAGEHTGP